jgi:signal transduction histidine kinase
MPLAIKTASAANRDASDAGAPPSANSLIWRSTVMLNEFVDSFLTGEWLSDPERARRARLVVRFGFLGLVFGMAYAAFYFTIGHAWGAWITVVCSVAFGGVPWLMRWTGRLKLAGNMLSAIMTLGFTGLVCVEGGLRGHAAAWLASVPLCALLLVGTKSARFWVLTCFAIGSLVVVAEIKEYNLPMTYDAAWHPLLTSAGYLGLILFMFVLGLIFENGRKRAFAKMQEALGKLASSNELLVILNREKTEFLGIASHDLKNPLTTIITYAQALEGSDDPADVPVVCTAIQTAGTQMRDLIVNLLDSNAIEEGRFNLKVEPCELSALIAQSVEHNRQSAARKEIALEIDTAAGVWANADQSTTVQVIDNLISNAIKYSPFQTTVRVTTSAENGEVLVAVKDEGPGIGTEDQARLFGKFTRLTARPTGGESSNGLGLSIVKKFAEAMSGAVECRSILGSGATFVVRLPAWEAVPPDAETKQRLACRPV